MAFKRGVLAALVLLTALYTIPWTVRNSLTTAYSGVDFHGYWYAGHFLRQGLNPFAAILNAPIPNYWNPDIPGSGDPARASGAENRLTLPIRYLDGPVVSEHPVARMLIVAPSVTAPLNLTLGLFAWFSWPAARLIWMVMNLIIAALIPWLALHLLGDAPLVHREDQWIFAFVFYNFYGLRQSIVVGQQALICLLLMVLALLYGRRSRWLAGIFLGLGISKYSVGTPIFLYFLRHRRFALVVTSLLLQGLALLLLLPLESGSPFGTLLAYYRIFSVNVSQEGVHVLARFENGLLQAVFFVLIVIVTLTGLARSSALRASNQLAQQVLNLHEMNLITVAVFLVTYHRVHDMSFMIFFFLAWIASLLELWQQAGDRVTAGWFLAAGLVLLVLVMFPTLPFQMPSLLPAAWQTVDAISSLTLLGMFGLSVWFLFRKPLQPKPAGTLSVLQ